MPRHDPDDGAIPSRAEAELDAVPTPGELEAEREAVSTLGELGVNPGPREREELERDEAELDEPEAPSMPDVTVDDAALRRLLEVNGFQAVRQEIMGVLGIVAGIPIQSLDAAIAYNRASTAGLELQREQRGDLASPPGLALARRELRVFRLVLGWRKELEALEQRMTAADRIVTP